MKSNSLLTRLLRYALVGLMVTGVTACDDDPADVEEEPEVQTIRLVVGSQTINFIASQPAAFIARGAHNVSVSFLRANGSVDPVVNATDFEVQITAANTSIVTFTRTGAFTGTLTGVAAGSTTLKVCLFHKGEQHCETGADVQASPITVQ